jgi:hypothetical protein
MSRQRDAFDDNFKTVTIDGKPLRVLKDKGRLRVSLTMRDSLSPLQRSVAGDTARDNNHITDGRSDNPTALNRPGFRVPVVNDRRAVHDAYATYDSELCSRYRCNDGKGFGSPNEGGYDTLDSASDSRTLDQSRQMMDRLYRERDAELQNAWRQS